jgi:hypothetical protein
MLRVFSALLGAEVTIAEDDENVPDTKEVVFRREELYKMQPLTAKEKKNIYQLKKHFGGVYLGPEVKVLRACTREDTTPTITQETTEQRSSDKCDSSQHARRRTTFPGSKRSPQRTSDLFVNGQD